MTQPRPLNSAQRPLLAVDSPRAFRIVVTQGRGDVYGITLEETYGNNGGTLTANVARATPAQSGRVIDAIFAAVRNSGHAPSILAFGRKAPIRLNEPDGVRLALVLLATQPMAKHTRVRALVAGINTMSTEETYYWYSKCIGVEARRARRALRTLLADD